jgi:hypothetical protein
MGVKFSLFLIAINAAAPGGTPPRRIGAAKKKWSGINENVSRHAPERPSGRGTLANINHFSPFSSFFE